MIRVTQNCLLQSNIKELMSGGCVIGFRDCLKRNSMHLLKKEILNIKKITLFPWGDSTKMITYSASRTDKWISTKFFKRLFYLIFFKTFIWICECSSFCIATTWHKRANRHVFWNFWKLGKWVVFSSVYFTLDTIHKHSGPFISSS